MTTQTLLHERDRSRQAFLSRSTLLTSLVLIVGMLVVLVLNALPESSAWHVSNATVSLLGSVGILSVIWRRRWSTLPGRGWCANML